MADEAETKKIRDLALPKGISYGIVQPGQHDPDGVPIIRVSDLMDGRISVSDPLKVATSIEASYSRTRLQGGELLISLVGTLGRVAIVPEELKGWNVARAIGVIRLKNPHDAQWIKTCLEQPTLQHDIASKANTTVQHTFNLSDLQDLDIPFPGLRLRQGVLDVINPLTAKIELNRRMNRTLEQVARALFKSWFVDFDPVRAKMRGEQPEGMDAETAALFPDRLVEVEGREVPEGWEVKGLDEIADFLNGLALQKFPPVGENDLPIIKIAELRRGNTHGSGTASSKIERKYIVKNGDVLFSWSGTLEVVRWSGGDGALNQHLFKVSSKMYPKWFYYYWLLEYLTDFRAIAASKATTMGHIQRSHLGNARVLVPPQNIIIQCGDKIESLSELIHVNAIENSGLSITRHLLLQKLLSGELEVVQ